MNEVKIYIKKEFGTYKQLAKKMRLSESTVKTAMSKNADVSWLNLLKHFTNKDKNESRLDKTT